MIQHLNQDCFHNTDSKGRLLLPKSVRESFKIKKGDKLYLLPDLSDPPYLEARTASQWADYRRSLREDTAGEKKKLSFRYADLIKETATVDGQGRFLIPQRMRDTCNLVGEVAVINMEDYFEIWAKGHVAKRFEAMVKAFKEINDRMF
jgi:DNA-binding transcriptional regulator/RsmH inhibitor MraZ